MSVGYVLADTSTFFAEGVIRILDRSQRLRFLGRSRTPQAVVALTRRRTPDVVVAGFEPPASSIELARRLDAPVVVMTWSWQKQELLGALDAGVKGFLRKDVSATDLEHALLHVAAGGTVAQPGWERGLSDRTLSVLSWVRRNNPVNLTRREVEIVQLVVDGHSNKRVAMTLGIAHQTTKNHLHNVMAKVGVSTRAELREWAIGSGYAARDAAASASADL
ncbi:MAG: LuxR C-terminal-related transcriptional regulator [Micromonosporaceae bacterium]